MVTIKYREFNRTGWSNGPWDYEPDEFKFIEPITKMPALILRNQLGNLCGYVGVDSSHPFYQKRWDDDTPPHNIEGIHVHGGVTFTGTRVEFGEPDYIWWIGFDTSHANDVSPTTKNSYSYPGCEYRTLEYVEDEISKMAVQIKEASDEAK